LAQAAAPTTSTRAMAVSWRVRRIIVPGEYGGMPPVST
jgi:hypothetical protein